MSNLNSLSRPTVSIAMATYNGEPYITEQVRSLLNQDYPITEIIVCDDNSSDATVACIEAFGDDRIKIHRNEQNLGYIKNFESACMRCQGDYIALCDQDDIWMPNKISTLVALAQQQQALAVFSDADLIDSDGNDLGAGLWAWLLKQKLPAVIDFRSFYLSNCVTGCTLLISRDLLAQTLPFPLAYPHDWWLAYHAAYRNKLCYSREKLVGYRQHATNTLGINYGAAKQNKLVKLLRKIWRAFCGARAREYLAWHDEMQRRLEVMKTVELAHGDAISAELNTLDAWITDKVAGKDLAKYSAFFEAVDQPALAFYRPPASVLSPMPQKLRKFRVRQVLLYLGALGLGAALISVVVG